jgi:uncharacterized membrane protein SirB2
MSGYLLARHVHQVTAAVTLLLFLLRGVWMLTDSPALQRRWVRIVPHVNDTILLAAAIYMTALIGLQPWIEAKIAGLLLYIGLGTVALKRGRTKAIRARAFAAALAAFAYVVAVALTKRVLPFAP